MRKCFVYVRSLPGHILSRQSSVISISPWQGAPPYIASVTLNLWFILKPSPHVLEHSPAVHSLHSQSTERKIESLVLWQRMLRSKWDIDNNQRFITWTFLNVTALHNWRNIGVWTFITPMESRLIDCSGKSPRASSTWQRTILDDPIIPFAMNYGINLDITLFFSLRLYDSTNCYKLHF